MPPIVPSLAQRFVGCSSSLVPWCLIENGCTNIRHYSRLRHRRHDGACVTALPCFRRRHLSIETSDVFRSPSSSSSPPFQMRMGPQSFSFSGARGHLSREVRRESHASSSQSSPSFRASRKTPEQQSTVIGIVASRSETSSATAICYDRTLLRPTVSIQRPPSTAGSSLGDNSLRGLPTILHDSVNTLPGPTSSNAIFSPA